MRKHQLKDRKPMHGHRLKGVQHKQRLNGAGSGLEKLGGAAHPEGSLLWGADFVEIGWLCIMTWKPMVTRLVS